MTDKLNRVVIVGSKRTPFVKSFGKFKKLSHQELLTSVLKDLVKTHKLEGKKLGDVIGGSVIKSARDFNLVRESLLGTDLDPKTPGLDIQRACGTSLEAAIIIANKIKLGQIEAGIACGVDTNSQAPIETSDALRDMLFDLNFARTTGARLKKLLSFRPRFLKLKQPSIMEPRTKKSMGQHCELMAKEWKVTREEQDLYAIESHNKAEEAYKNGFYEDLVQNINDVTKDQFVRAGSTPEQLAKLKPAFDKKNGSLTAANSTPFTDGAAAVLLASEDYAKENGLPILAYVVDGQASAVDFVGGDGLLMAPTSAVSEMLTRMNVSLADFDRYEIHEAFAAQALSTMKAWEDRDYCVNKLGLDAPLGSIDRTKLNIMGGSLAIGHPFAATGARLLGATAKILNTDGKGRALITACTAGGMGVAMAIEK